MGEQIQCIGSAIPVVRLVIDPQEGVFDGVKKLLVQGAFNNVERVERQRHRVVRVAGGRCSGSGRACRDDGHCAGIERGDKYFSQKGRIDGGGGG